MGYTVNDFEFVYISKVNPYKPLVFVVPDKMHLAAMEGFTDRYGYKYKGVKQLLEEYYSCTERGFCDYTEEEELAKGRVIMNDII